MSNLRSKLIRLAHARPELRSDLLPLVSKTASVQLALKEWRQLINRKQESLDTLQESMENLTGAELDMAREAVKVLEASILQMKKKLSDWRKAGLK